MVIGMVLILYYGMLWYGYQALVAPLTKYTKTLIPQAIVVTKPQWHHDTTLLPITTPSSTRPQGVAAIAMLHINLVLLGKLKETFWQEAEAEYVKRLKPYAKVTIYELKEESFSEKENVEIVKQKESEKIITALNKIKGSYIIALDEHGKQFSSPDFANQINQLMNQRINELTFIIGGPLGLDQSIIQRANLKLSLSQLTFTHQMARVFLWEQIYRAFCINGGKKYHY